MDRNLDALSLCACEDVELPIASIVQVLGTHQRSHLRVFIMSSQLLSLRGAIVAQVEQIVGGASLVLLPGVEVILLRLEDGALLGFIALHRVKSLYFSLESILPAGIMHSLFLLKLLLPHSLVCHCEILVESVLLYINDCTVSKGS